jgi:hypothetical protein
VHQVGLKDSESQNFSFLALKAEPVGELQILRTATATARDRRKIPYVASKNDKIRLDRSKITEILCENALLVETLNFILRLQKFV